MACDGLVSEPRPEPLQGAGGAAAPGGGEEVTAGGAGGAGQGGGGSVGGGGGGGGGTAGGSAGGSGAVYPGLPASCQGLLNRTHGTCEDGYANPNYGSIAWVLKARVDQALARVSAPPEWFDGDAVVRERRADFAGLVGQQLDADSVCGVWDGTELYVRDRVRDYSETYSLFTQAGRPRVGGHWQCEPSDAIPRTRPGFSCALPPSNGTSCNGAGNNHFAVVLDIVEEIIREEQALDGGSQLIDFRFKSGHVRGWRLIDDGYPFIERVARKAVARGFCATTNGWKWVDLKASNTLSETYSMVTHVSLPDPAQKPDLYAACLSDGIAPSCEFIIEKGEATCRPADF